MGSKKVYHGFKSFYDENKDSFTKEVPELEPFDIVTAYYTCFSGGIKKDYKGRVEPSLFLVIAVNDDKTVTACKITSNASSGNVGNNYSLTLLSHPFLQADSFVQCDKIHTLSQYKCRKIGSMIDFCRRGFISKFTLVFGAFRINLEKYAPKYVSPSIKLNK